MVAKYGYFYEAQVSDCVFKMESLYVHTNTMLFVLVTYLAKEEKIKQKTKIVSNNFPLLQFKCTNGCNMPVN